MHPAATAHQAPRAIAALILREMATSYGRSPGGYIWAVLEPVAAIALLSLVFSAALHAPSLGTSFPLFYAAGYLPFQMFNDLATRIGTALRFSRPLLAYPAVTFIDALIARFLLAAATHLVVGLIVLAGIFALFDTATILRPGPIAAAVAMTAALGFGIGALHCFLLMSFPVWERLWQILMRPLFVVSGVFFILEDVPHGFRDLLWFNPVLHVTAELRRGLHVTYEPAWVSPGYVCGVALVTAAFGLLLLRRHQSEILHS